MVEAETVAEWSTRWIASRRARGIASVRDDHSRLRCHVLPEIGDAAIAFVGTDRLEDLRDSLDGKIRNQGVAWRTAHHVWALVRAMFRDASRGKDRALRVRSDEPTERIATPDRGVCKEKPFLFPSEYLMLLRADTVPLAWRRLAALATCLYVRASELEALRWDDVELKRGLIHVHRSVDREHGRDKPTKGCSGRRFLIEPSLLPLLRRLHRDARGVGSIASTIGRIDRYALARELRTHLRHAGVRRAELFANDQTRSRITFHDLRATGITWMAIRGDDPLKIKQRAGHRSLSTTERYIRVAEELRAGFGDVFPRLPDALLQGRSET